MKPLLLIGVLPYALVASLRAGDSWPQFRGPSGDGSSPAKGLPLAWSEQTGVKWKAPIHGRAWSSPVIWNDQIWLTTASEDGKELSVLCLARASGKCLRDDVLFQVEKPQFAHKFNSYGSPTPVIEEGRIYVTFGAPATACLDTTSGKILWERRDLECNHFRGAGSSPILWGNLLIMNFDGSDHQFIIALDKQSGKTIWKTQRSIDYKDLTPDGKPEADGDWRKAFSTPHVAELDGTPALLSIGAKATYGYEPLTGRELWRVEERSSHSAGTRPLVVHGLVIYPTGWSSGQILAIRPGAPGDSIDANAPTNRSSIKIVWRTKRNVPKKPSLQCVGDRLFAVDDGGIASCLNADTGEELWRERVGGNYSASPIAAEGRVYFFSEEGKTTVIAASDTFKVLAENKLDDGFMASPAVAGKALFLRTKTNLYRIED